MHIDFVIFITGFLSPRSCREPVKMLLLDWNHRAHACFTLPNAHKIIFGVNETHHRSYSGVITHETF